MTEKKAPHTFCSKCNRVISWDEIDGQGRCPDCQTPQPQTKDEPKKKGWKL